MNDCNEEICCCAPPCPSDGKVIIRERIGPRGLTGATGPTEQVQLGKKKKTIKRHSVKGNRRLPNEPPVFYAILLTTYALCERRNLRHSCGEGIVVDLADYFSYSHPHGHIRKYVDNAAVIGKRRLL